VVKVLSKRVGNGRNYQYFKKVRKEKLTAEKVNIMGGKLILEDYAKF